MYTGVRVSVSHRASLAGTFLFFVVVFVFVFVFVCSCFGGRGYKKSSKLFAVVGNYNCVSLDLQNCIPSAPPPPPQREEDYFTTRERILGVFVLGYEVWKYKELERHLNSDFIIWTGRENYELIFHYP